MQLCCCVSATDQSESSQLHDATSTDQKMNLNAIKQITESVSVVATMNEIQVTISGRVEYVWFCNSIEQARGKWRYAVDVAKRIA